MSNPIVRASATALPKSRRTTLRLLAGAGALVIAPVASIAATAERDPIFAAIGQHKARNAAFLVAICLTDQVVADREGRTVTEDDERVYNLASSKERESLAMIVETVPTTAVGIRAAIEYVAALDDFETLADFTKTFLKSPVLSV